MKKMSLDLSKLKHMSSTKTHTTLQHDDGHVITLAHAALSPDNQKQLQALSDISKDSATPLQQDEQNHNKAHFYDGGDTDDSRYGYVPASASRDPKDAPASFAPIHSSQRTQPAKQAPVVDSETTPSKQSAPDPADQGYTTYAQGGKVNLVHQTTNKPLPDKPSSGTLDYKQINQEKRQMNQAEASKPVMGRKMYADSEEPVSQDDSAPVQQATEAATAVPPNVSDVPPTAISVNNPDIGVPTEVTPTPPKDPEREFDALYNQSKANQPWLSDDLHKDAAYKTLENAKADAENAEDDKKSSDASTIANASQENQRRQNLGLPPLELAPSPGEQAPGQDPNMVNPSAPAQVNHQPAAGDMSQKPVGDSMDPYSTYKRGYQDRLAGEAGKAAAITQEAGDRQAVLHNDEMAKQKALQTYQADYAQLNKERLDHIDDIKNGYVDPNKYWDDHSKIASGIGMILAGFNPTSNPNAAISFLQKQMDNNLHAQERNLGAKQSLLQANMQQFGNLKDARAMTQIMQKDVVANQLDQAAARAASPAAKAAALSAKGVIEQDASKQFMQFPMMRSLQQLSAGGSDPATVNHALGMLRMLNPEAAKEYESRYVPGVGTASIPLTPEIRSKLTGHQNMNMQVDDLINFLHSHRNMLPGSPEYNVAKEKVLALQSGIRENQLGTVYKQGEQGLLNKFVDVNPIGFMNDLKAIPQLHELKAMNNREMGITANSVGLKLPQSAQPQIKTDKNGVQWQRGPNGEAVRVK